MSETNELFKLRKLRKRSRNHELYEHAKSHPLFSQLDELYLNPRQELVWLEKARWLKFVEVVDDCGRWSKPHVATLPLHSLIDLRSLISHGTVMLNYNGTHLRQTIDDLIERVLVDYNLREELASKLRNTLYLPHIHQYEKNYCNQLDLGKKQAFPLLTKRRVPHSECQESENDANDANRNGTEIKKDADNATDTDSASELNEEGEEEDESISIDLESIDYHRILNTINKRNKAFMCKIPHRTRTANVLIGEVDYLKDDQEITVLIRFSHPIMLENITEVPLASMFLFILLGPKGNMLKYRNIGKCISTLFSDELFQGEIQDAADKIDIIKAIDDFLDQTTILPPGEWDTSIRLSPPNKVPSKEERLVLKMIKVKKDKPHIGGHDDDPCLQRTGKICGGLLQDVKRKARWYLSDFTDAFNLQLLPAIAFLYFACLSPIITFGSLLGYATDQNMGAIESLLSGLITGVSFSLFAGQPLTIMGSTGPVLVFESILNAFSKAYGIDYMGFRCYVGLWTALFLLIITITDMSYLVKYITRFTEELFAILIALIFVHESIDKLLKIKKYNHYNQNPFVYGDDFNPNSTRCFRCVHKNNTASADVLTPNNTIYTERECENLGLDYEFLRECQNVPDVFFFCVILYICTFLLAISLRNIRASSFLPTAVRTKFSNFSVVITIAVMVLLDHLVGLNTPKLHVPAEFHPTIPNRGWFIDPIARNRDKWWLVFAAILPALLSTILVFMDQHITAVIVNRKGNKLQKSAGYHLDMFVCAVCIAVNSLLGLPWFVAATVLSMNHIIALRKTSNSNVPGESAKLIGVIEQRVSGTIVFILIGCSIFLTHVLSLIPMAVLYAVFMFMGVTPMVELEFFQRILLMLMPKKHQPDLVFLRQVRLSRVHLFTAIQIVCLLILFFLKLNKKISITFPLMVLALVFIRFGMNYIFTEKELSFLDDIIPGMGSKRKKKLSVHQLNVQVLEKAARNETSPVDQEEFLRNLRDALKKKEDVLTSVPEKPVSPQASSTRVGFSGVSSANAVAANAVNAADNDEGVALLLQKNKTK